ncbi:MAG: hypothetical protein M5U26_05915 [Planctomycetota bacterium]|nr:hypothetical protein [Planctomycetota bacterium]
MFEFLAWLFPTDCPIEQKEVEWLVKRLNWLMGQFGSDDFTKRQPVAPEGDFSARAFDRSPRDMRRLFSCLCRHLKLDERYVDFQLYEGEKRARAEFDLFTGAISYQSSSTPGLYRDGYDQKVLIDRGLGRDFDGLIATLAHELAHVKLHRESDIQPDWEDYEKLTDLAAVFFGFGIFQARTAERDFRPDYDGYEVPTNRMGYLPTAVICHALAMSAWIQKDLKPGWIGHLDWRTRRNFKRSIRYMRGDRNCVLGMDAAGALVLQKASAQPVGLEEKLRQAIEREDYGEAARLKKLIEQDGSKKQG